jgi:hypothetical protein
MQLGLDNSKRGVEVRAHATVLLNLASDAQLLHPAGGGPAQTSCNVISYVGCLG